MKFILMALAAAGHRQRYSACRRPRDTGGGGEDQGGLGWMELLGRQIGKETEGSDVLYEVEDAKGRDGVYEIKLDKDFKVIEISRDDD
jgi:hypothetical protein